MTNLVRINTPKVVQTETRKAFRKLPNVEQAISTLTNLKGVGTTLASGLSSASLIMVSYLHVLQGVTLHVPSQCGKSHFEVVFIAKFPLDSIKDGVCVVFVLHNKTGTLSPKISI